MEINITEEKLDYLTKKYGDSSAIIQRIINDWIENEIDRDYQKENINTSTNDKLEFIKTKRYGTVPRR